MSSQAPFRLHLWRNLAFLALVTGTLILPARSVAQNATQRLILKDGSYQMVSKYEIKGDRVRYYSAERDEWEEIPKSLVDWPATEKYEKDQAANESAPAAVELDKEAEHEREVEHEREFEETQLPEVAPGLRLPEPSGVFLLETFEGQPQLVELRQSEGDIDQKAKGNIFRDAITPLAGIKAVIELDGAHAATQSHVDVPSIYINIDDTPDDASQGSAPAKSSAQPQQPEQPQQAEQAIVPFDRFRIVRTEIKNGKRIMGDLKRAPTGKVSQDQHFMKTTIDRINGGWLKLTPSEPLTPGEYALIEMAGNQAINLEVWDFGVNPKAAANPNTWKPEAKAPASAPAKTN